MASSKLTITADGKEVSNLLALLSTLPSTTEVKKPSLGLKKKKPENTPPKPKKLSFVCKLCGTTKSSRWNWKTRPTGPICSSCYQKNR